MDEQPESAPQKLHFRNRKTKAALCGADTSGDGHRLFTTWKSVIVDGEYLPDVCPDCIAARSVNSNTHRKTEDPQGPDLEEIKQQGASVAFGLLNAKLYANGKAPLDEHGTAALTGTVHSAVDVLDHYGLIGVTSHPLVPFAVNAFLLLRAIKAIPQIESQSELNRAHGLPESYGSEE